MAWVSFREFEAGTGVSEWVVANAADYVRGAGSFIHKHDRKRMFHAKINFSGKEFQAFNSIRLLDRFVLSGDGWHLAYDYFTLGSIRLRLFGSLDAFKRDATILRDMCEMNEQRKKAL